WLVGWTAVSAAAAAPRARRPVRAHSYRSARERLDARCAYCGRPAVTSRVVNGGAIPVCPRHAWGDDEELPEPAAPAGIAASAHPAYSAALPLMARRGRRARRHPASSTHPPVLPPADGLYL